MMNVYSLHYDMRVLSNFVPLAMIILVILIQRKVKESQRKFVNSVIADLCMIQIFLLAVLVLEYQKVYIPYKNNSFQFIEGEISEYETDSKVEKFEVRGVKFQYADTDMMLGYNQIKENGGVIFGNGQKVRIGYIRYNGRNVIVSIEGG